jgi:hypothetical protein
MKSKALFLFCVFLFLAGFCQAQVAYGPKDTIKVATTNYNGEIIPWIVIGEVTVIDKRTFKSQADYDNYRRLKYNVLKVLPYARFAGQRYRQLEKDLALTSDKRKQKQLIKSCDKEIKDLFNDKIKNLTISQGEILIKLVDRETGNSSYDLVQNLKGNISAFLVQSVARVFGHDLKTKYDVDQEMDIEGIIHSAGYYSYQ